MFTHFVEAWIKPAEEEYTKKVEQGLSGARKANIHYQYPEYGRQVIQKMNAIRREYCHGYLGFSLICRLHQKYAEKTDVRELCKINGRVLHAANAAQPSVVHGKYPEDLDTYVELFMELAKKSGKFVFGKDVSEELLRSRFTKILRENRYVGPRGGIAQISRENVIDVCIYLGWDSNDANYLLLRMDDSCLSANSASDLMSRFVLDLPEATMADRTEIKRRYRRVTKRATLMRFEDKGQKGTRDRVDIFGRILRSDVPLKKKRDDYAEALAFYAPVFELPSKTARNYLERILRVAYVRLGNKDAELETIQSNISLTIFNDKLSALSPQQQDHLLEVLLSETEGADINALKSAEVRYDIAYDALSYPVLDNEGQFAQQLMGVRFKQLLSGAKPVTKRDMLYAIFLMESIAWRGKKLTDAKAADKRYRMFKALADEILAESFLPPFYPVQALEYLIGSAIYMGETRGEAVFAQITGRFDALKDPEMDLLTNIPEEKDDLTETKDKEEEEKEKEEFAYKKLFGNLVDLLYYRTSKMAVIPERTKTEAEKAPSDADEKKDGSIMLELAKIASVLYDIWSNNHFDAMDVNFEMAGNIGIKAVGLSQKAKYIKVWTMSETLKKYLHEAEKNTSILKEITIPDLDGTEKSLAAYAAQYPAKKDNHEDTEEDEQENIEEGTEKHGETLLSVLEKNVDWNRRLRRKCILSIVAGMLLNLYGRKAFAAQYRLSKVASDETDPRKAIMEILREEKETDAFKFFDIYVKKNTILKLYSASREDYGEYLEKQNLKK